jgi:excisionase family DNA binding protein
MLFQSPVVACKVQRSATRGESKYPEAPGAIVGYVADDPRAETMTDSEPSSARSAVEPRFLTLEDVATYLNVSVTQVYALVRSGELPGIKIGGRGFWRVDREQLEAYIEQLHHKTKEWAKAHPLNSRDGE